MFFIEKIKWEIYTKQYIRYRKKTKAEKKKQKQKQQQRNGEEKNDFKI